MDITKILKPNKNNIVLTIILLFLTSIPTYQISTSVILIIAQTITYGNGLPLPYLISTSKTILFFLPGGNAVNVNYVNLLIDILIWFIVASLIAWKFLRGKRK